MMHTPQISIIVPIYNTEKYLRNCLLSLQNQSMQDFEVILINDCTPDNSMEIVNDFIQSDSRFHLIQHKENRGLGCARNTGIENANGKYINFLDSDDRLPRNALNMLIENAMKSDADMVIGNMAWVYNHYLSPVEYIEKRIQNWLYESEFNIRQLSEESCLSGSVCNRLIKKELIKENSLLFPENLYFEDIPFTMAAWYKSKNIATTPNYIYFRTKRSETNNLSITQLYNEKAFFDRDGISQIIFEFARDNAGASRLGAVTLMSMLSTTKSMIDNANEDIKQRIKLLWFPKHVIYINTFIDKLNEIYSKHRRSIQNTLLS